MSIKKRLQKLEEPLKPVSIFADWCIARDPEWDGTDKQAFDEWLKFQETATPEQYESEALNPNVGSIGDGFHSSRF